MMEYKLEEVVWEMSRKCNLNCIHCGSDCSKEVYGEELNQEEMKRAAEELLKTSMKSITLSGGEPLLHPMWRTLAALFSEAGVKVGMVTNGTLITKQIAQDLKKAGLRVVSVSIDGLEHAHNEIRQKNCYHTCIAALDYLKEAGISTAVNTTVSKKNLNDLSSLYEVLKQHEVCSWQIQIALPSGRMSKQKEHLLDVKEIESLVNFAYEENIKGGRTVVFLAETIGYYTLKESLSRQTALQSERLPVWRGCPAGISGMGIMADGNIIGCTSLQEAWFREKNIKALWEEDKTILDYWNSPNAFTWRRTLKAEQLEGACEKCRYAMYCLGGCSNARYGMNGTIYSSNPLCLYQEIL